MADRDDANLKHFESRSKQAKGPAHMQPAQATVNVNLMFDSGFGTVSDQVETSRFRYQGAVGSVSTPQAMNHRRVQHDSMSAYNW